MRTASASLMRCPRAPPRPSEPEHGLESFDVVIDLVAGFRGRLHLAQLRASMCWVMDLVELGGAGSGTSSAKLTK